MRFIVAKTGKRVAGAVAGAVGVTIFCGHPEIRHLHQERGNIPAKAVEVAALSTTATQGKMDVIYSIPPTPAPKYLTVRAVQ